MRYLLYFFRKHYFYFLFLFLEGHIAGFIVQIQRIPEQRPFADVNQCCRFHTDVVDRHFGILFPEKGKPDPRK